MRPITLSLVFASILIPSVAGAQKPKPLGFWGRAKVRLAPVRVYQSPKALSKVSLGLNNKRPFVKAVARKLADGRLVFKQYGYKVVGNKTHRSVFSTVVSPDGSAKNTLVVKGLMRRSWAGTQDYKQLAKGLSSGRARASAVMASPATKGGLMVTLFAGALATMPGATAATVLKGLWLPGLWGGAIVWGSSSSQLKPSVQNLNE